MILFQQLWSLCLSFLMFKLSGEPGQLSLGQGSPIGTVRGQKQDHGEEIDMGCLPLSFRGTS